MAVALSSAASAHAQSEPSSPAAEPPAAPARASEADDVSAGEIVVTASRRSEAISRAPLAISALSQDDLTESGVVGLANLSSTVPSVQISTIGFTNTVQVTIRGITNTNFNGGNPAVATYVDGIYVPRTQGLNGSLFDVSRVEVLRGPQGTLYGRNSTGGNLNVITADPVDRFEASAEASFGSYDELITKGMVNVPLSDTFYVRAAFATMRNDGYFKSKGTTADDYGADDNYAGRLTVMWNPAENLSWRLAAEQSVVNGTAAPEFITDADGRPADNLPIYERAFPSFPEPDKYVRNFMVRSKLDWTFAPDLTLTYLAGYQNLDYSSQGAVAGAGTSGPYDSRRTGGSRNYSQELDLSLDTERLKAIVGVNYFDEKTYDRQAYHLYTFGSTLRTGPGRGPIGTNEAYGIFGQATYSLTPSLRLTGGIRYSHEKQADALSNGAQSFCPLGLTFQELLAEAVPASCFVVIPSVPQSGSWSNVNWKAGVELDLTPRLLGYASVTTGFKAGGLNGNVPDEIPNSYEPEKVINYEVGVKGRVGDILYLSANAFLSDYTDLQVTQLATTSDGTITNITSNAAKARIYGTEIEATLQLSPDDRLSGYATLLSAKYDNYPNAVDQQANQVFPNLKGNRLINAPSVQFRVSYEHDFHLPNGGKITPQGIFYVQSKSYLREFNLPIDQVDGYTRTDLNLGYDDPTGRWNVTAFVRNLEDKAVRNNAFSVIGLYLSDYNLPRTWGIRGSYKF